MAINEYGITKLYVKTMVSNVSDHVELWGDSFRYIRGLTKLERGKALAVAEMDQAPVLVAKITFRKGSRWYWLYGKFSTEFSYKYAKTKDGRSYLENTIEYTRTRIRVSPVRDKGLKDILDKLYPDTAIAKRGEPEKFYKYPWDSRGTASSGANNG